MVMALKIRGPFLGPSGYDQHVREFTRSLVASGVAVELENAAEWSPVQLPFEARDPWFESLRQPVPARTTLHFCFPTQVRPDHDRFNVNFTMFEATRISASWVAAHPHVDRVIVPTEHSMRAWVESGVPEAKLRLCPLGVRADLFRPGVPPLPLTDGAGRLLTSYATRVLNVSELGARKNLGGLLTAWLRATSARDDAILVLKVGEYNPGSMTEFEIERRDAEARAGKRFEDAAPVHILHGLYPDLDMPRLFTLGTHYISLSFGEGWDLSMTQAAASGLRLIAPRHSAYLEYLDDDIASLVSAREAPALNRAGTWIAELFEGSHWWLPDEDEAVERIRAAIDGADAPAASASERVRQRYTWDAAARRLLEVIAEVEATTTR